jgi:hypothetical protein
MNEIIRHVFKLHKVSLNLFNDVIDSAVKLLHCDYIIFSQENTF